MRRTREHLGVVVEAQVKRAYLPFMRFEVATARLERSVAPHCVGGMACFLCFAATMELPVRERAVNVTIFKTH